MELAVYLDCKVEGMQRTSMAKVKPIDHLPSLLLIASHYGRLVLLNLVTIFWYYCLILIFSVDWPKKKIHKLDDFVSAIIIH